MLILAKCIKMNEGEFPTEAFRLYADDKWTDNYQNS